MACNEQLSMCVNTSYHTTGNENRLLICTTTLVRIKEGNKTTPPLINDKLTLKSNAAIFQHLDVRLPNFPFKSIKIVTAHLLNFDSRLNIVHCYM